jgi:hypothetical protein
VNESSSGINYDEDTKTIILWTDEENSIAYCRKGETVKAIGNIFQERHNMTQGKLIEAIRNTESSKWKISKQTEQSTEAILKN